MSQILRASWGVGLSLCVKARANLRARFMCVLARVSALRVELSHDSGTSWPRMRWLLVIALVAATAAACDSGTPKVTPKFSTVTTSTAVVSTGAPSATTAGSQFATLYLQILGPADAASGEFFAAVKKLPSTATGADAQKIATPAADAIDAADKRLLAVTWPANIAAGVKKLVLVDAQLVRDLRNVGTQQHITSGTWKPQFESDVAKVTNQVGVVVADLRAPTTSK